MSKNNKIDFLDGPIVYTLKKMTIPVIYGMILLMTFNLVDTFFVGLLGTKPLAAISFTFPVTFTVISLMIGLGIGTSAVIAKLLGNKEDKLAKLTASSSLYLGAVVVVLLSLLGYIFVDQIFGLLGASESALILIHQYMDVWYLGSIFLIGPMIGNAILRASGDTKTPSIVMGSAGLINAFLDPLLIFGAGPIPSLGIQGAAIATLISWAFGFCFIIYILLVKKKLIDIKFPPLSAFKNAVVKIAKIGFPAAGANMLTPLAAAVMTAIVAQYGESAVAAFGVGSRLESIACLVILALSMTLPPFISQNLGAGNMPRIEKSYQASIKFVLVWQVFIYFLLVILAPFIADAFAKEQKVADIIQLFIWILPLGYGLQGVIILTNSSFNALHKPMVALFLSIVRLFICYVPFAYLGNIYFGLEGLFIGALFGNIIMAGISYYFFTKQFSNKKNETKVALS